MRKIFTILFSFVFIACFGQRGFVKGTNDTMWYYDGVNERVQLNKFSTTGVSTNTLNDSASALRTAVNAKAPAASPVFTGTPVIPGYLPNTTTSGVAASPTASGTVTVTHNLGRVPTTIRIKSISSFTSNAAATPVPFSEGTWNSTGNRCLYMVINGTTTQVSQTSTVFSIIMVTSAGNQITGVIGNLTLTTFDIVFTETGTHTAGNYLWEAQ